MRFRKATAVALALVLPTVIPVSARAAPSAADRDLTASTTEHDLRAALGPAFGGAWLPADGGPLVVAVTDPAQAATVRAHGGRARVVRHSAADLDKAQRSLESGTPPASITSWYVDVPTGQVVVRALPGDAEAVGAFVAARIPDRSLARIETDVARPAAFADVVGGNGFGRTPYGSDCSVGYSVTAIDNPATVGFVTAGHCIDAGFYTYNPQGDIMAANHPGTDFGWVRTGTSWNPTPSINMYDGGFLTVTGWKEALVGASVCASGFISRWSCGTIQARNVTVQDNGQTINGLTRTTICRGPGDSGGPVVAASQAQGMITGGVPGCTSTGESYFQPLIPALARYRLRLAGVPGNSTPPKVLGLNCEVLPKYHFGCDVNAFHPDPLQIRWTINGVASPVNNDQEGFTAGCGKNQRISVRVTVSNAGGSDSASSSVVCGEPD